MNTPGYTFKLLKPAERTIDIDEMAERYNQQLMKSLIVPMAFFGDTAGALRLEAEIKEKIFHELLTGKTK